MTDRMAKLDRLLALVHALADSMEGLTLDEMADRLGVTRRTAERMLDVIARHFDLEEQSDDRHKRFRIRDGLRRVFTRPDAAEVAALQAEVDARRAAGQTARATPLESLLGKVRGALDDRERRRLEPDLEALARLQRTYVPAGPATYVEPRTLACIQGAVLAGRCVEFDYATDDQPVAQWRRVIPYGLVHGALTYLIGKLPGRADPPVYYRLDRMTDVRASPRAGCAPEDFDLDAWLAESFGIWRDDDADIVLRVLPAGLAQARTWRFHPRQTLEERADGTVFIRFRAGGLRELADHLFTWGGAVVIEEPEALRAVMRERLEAAAACLMARTA